MHNQLSRRYWLKNTAAVLAGFGIVPTILQSAIPAKKSSGIIFLNSNENALGPSPAAAKAMTEALIHSNRYPDEQIPALKNSWPIFGMLAGAYFNGGGFV